MVTGRGLSWNLVAMDIIHFGVCGAWLALLIRASGSVGAFCRTLASSVSIRWWVAGPLVLGEGYCAVSSRGIFGAETDYPMLHRLPRYFVVSFCFSGFLFATSATFISLASW